MTLSVFGYLIHFTKDTRLEELAAKLDQLLSARQADIDALTTTVASVNQALTHATKEN